MLMKQGFMSRKQLVNLVDVDHKKGQMYDNIAISQNELGSLWQNTDNMCRYGAVVLNGNNRRSDCVIDCS